jgi:hypothetical protein
VFGREYDAGGVEQRVVERGLGIEQRLSEQQRWQ